MNELAHIRTALPAPPVVQAAVNPFIEVSRVLRLSDPPSAHPPRVCACRGEFPDPVRRRRRELDHRGAAAARRRLDRAADVDACGADREAAAGGHLPPVRLGRHRPDRAAQTRRVSARPESYHVAGQDAGARRERSAAAARQHRWSTPIELRDRVLIVLMMFSFAGGAALAMRVDDVHVKQRRLSVR